MVRIDSSRRLGDEDEKMKVETEETGGCKMREVEDQGTGNR
jgi:hypothetical protein